MAALLAQAIQYFLNPLAKPIRNEFSNLALRLLVGIVFSTLGIFSGLQALQALQSVLKELVYGPQIEIAAFSVLLLVCLGVVFSVLRRTPKPVQKEFDISSAMRQFLDGVLSGVAKKEEAPVKEPLL